MTDNIEWGEPIAVDGARLNWLRDGETYLVQSRIGGWYADPETAPNSGFSVIEAIRLPASHEFYTVQRYNKEHGTSFTYWPGGDEAPVDWNDGPVLRTDADVNEPDTTAWYRWRHWGTPDDIIGYTRRTEQPAADAVMIVRKTFAEWEKRYEGHVGDWARYILNDLGLIKPEPTPAERIATDTGLDLTTVERVLAAQEKLNA